MIVRELEQLPTGRKAIQEFEKLVEKSPDIYFNLANTKQPLEAEYISLFELFNNQLIGLNILLDSCDSLEMEDIQSFTKLEYLRLSFTGCSIDDTAFSCLQSWLLELTELKAIVISSPPKNKERIKDIVQALSWDKPFPLTVIYQIKRLGSKSRKIAGDNSLPIPAVGNANIYQATNVMLNSEGIKDIIQNAKKLRSTSPNELHYSGHLEIEGGKWILDVSSLYVNDFKELVLIMEGFDNDRSFDCSCRCYWQEAAGGFYFASHVPITYKDYPSDNETISIKIQKLMIDSVGKCKIEGYWLQVGEEWAIDGELTKVKTTKIIESIELA